jgi:hypothetical protein
MILNSPEEDFSKIDISQVVNFEDTALIVEKDKKAADRPKSAKRPGTAKKKKPLEKIENEEKKPVPQQPSIAQNGQKMFPKAKGLG